MSNVLPPQIVDNKKMIKKIFLTLFIIHLSLIKVYAVCPVGAAMPLKAIEEQIKEKFDGVNEYIYLGYTPTGFVLSIKDELMFDECGCLTDTGKILLNALGQIMKLSGRRWMILVHSKIGETQVDRISRTSLRAGAITNYLTDQEKCLINQLFPIGFGSIMPTKNATEGRKALGNRIDFLVEDYNLRID